MHPPQAPAGGNKKKQCSNTIMSTSFALKFWSNKIIDVDIIPSCTLIASKKNLLISFYRGETLSRIVFIKTSD